MNGDEEGVASRPRPLSSGLWTLFSWLRRDDHASSNESLSSVGSDRTAASFAFLAPANYSVNSTPVLLPPPSPPTDSYRKRVQERNVRRQHERDLTLHRKYGLYRIDNSNGYDAFSLPPARRAEGNSSSKWERERRATSECFQRRALHVPGKRRAPLPPVGATVASSVTHYRGPRKRAAPQPPTKLIEENKERELLSNNISTHMNPETIHNHNNLQNSNIETTNRSEKCIKKSKDTKSRVDKGFLKHIFDNKKRSSVIDTSTVKILPNISELDKQAATIIEYVKLDALKQNSNSDKQNQQNVLDNSNTKSNAGTWFCIKCLRKYDSSISDCPYCIFDKKLISTDVLKVNIRNDAINSSSNYTQTESVIANKTPRNNKNEEKQKLKEMLKEMKDSLPKRPKHENKGHILNENNIGQNISNILEKYTISETPTLRIGSFVSDNITDKVSTKPSTSTSGQDLIISKKPSFLESFESVITSTPVVIQHDAKQNIEAKDSSIKLSTSVSQNQKVNENITLKNLPSLNEQKIENKSVGATAPNKNLQTPLRISSLLNPVYIPKNAQFKITPIENELHTPSDKINKQVPQSTEHIHCKINKTEKPSMLIPLPKPTKSDINATVTNNGSSNVSNSITVSNNTPVSSPNENNADILIQPGTNDMDPSTSSDISASNNKIKTADTNGLSQHIKRRELINQLEKSIANGDEHAAAEAAIKLAQLRLSCSVLSFSSQIISEPSTSVVPRLFRNEKTKIPPQKSESGNAGGLDLQSKSVKVIIPTTSSSQEKSPQNNEIKLNISRNEKIVQVGTKSPPEKICSFKNNTSFIPQDFDGVQDASAKEKENTVVSISVWVEDKEATRGPIKINTHRQSLVGDLRRQAEATLGLPSNLQRWIIGRTLCTDDNTPLITLAGSEFNAPFYLCLVETDPRGASTSRPTEKNVLDVVNIANITGNNVYKELVQLELQPLVPNAEVFECGVCIEQCKPGSGVILRECVHMFCKDCLADVVRHSEEPDISCPAMGCGGVLQEREIKGLVSTEDYERWLARGLAAAESGTRNAFHCRTKDCTGWALCEPGVRRFFCPVCKHSNCVPCQAIHEGETCEKYRAKLQAVSTAKSGQSDESTRALLNNLINKGEALECPECKAIITKMWGCDWVKCSACKTEICWVTRGRRWGPGGRGDTSAGCRCGVDGKRCHPSCGYCH